jgi:hypothetical protein
MVDHSGTAPESWIPSLGRDYNNSIIYYNRTLTKVN